MYCSRKKNILANVYSWMLHDVEMKKKKRAWEINIIDFAQPTRFCSFQLPFHTFQNQSINKSLFSSSLP